MIENVAEKVERLRRLVRATGNHISFEMEMWVRPSGALVLEWGVWDGIVTHKGATAEEALRAAELAHGLREASVPDAIVLPGAEICERVEEGR